jgi:hypothetical protein
VIIVRKLVLLVLVILAVGMVATEALAERGGIVGNSVGYRIP